MTRFKELERIEAALEHRDSRELRWALQYCKMRLELAKGQGSLRKHTTKHWMRIEARVSAALAELGSPEK